MNDALLVFLPVAIVNNHRIYFLISYHTLSALLLEVLQKELICKFHNLFFRDGRYNNRKNLLMFQQIRISHTDIF